MPINVSEEVFSPSGMLKGPRKQLMQFFIVGAERVNLIVEVVFNPGELVLFFIEIASFLLDVLKIE
jgi:hypothetical protein